MNYIAKVALTQGVFFASIAKKCFESALEASTTHFERKAMNNYISKCKWIEMDIMSNAKDDTAREHFRNEILKGDTLQFGSLIETYLLMSPDERDRLETALAAIRKGAIVEIKELSPAETT